MATINETLRDESIAHALWISRYSTGVAGRMVKTLNESDAELSARLIVALETMDPMSFTVQRLETMLVGVREINRQATAAYLNGMTTELRDFAEHEAGFQLSLFDALLPDEVKTRYPLQSVTPEMVYAAAMSKPFQGKLLREWASGLEADRMARVSNTIRQGFLLGDTTTQLAKKYADSRTGVIRMARCRLAAATQPASLKLRSATLQPLPERSSPALTTTC